MATSPPSPSRLAAWLAAHAPACFLLMSAAFIVFGLLSLDLVRLVAANAGFLWRSGWDGLIADGGWLQLLELMLGVLAAIAAYLVFKLCEHVLVQRLAFGRR
ncbi:hypothetical protein [Roseateles violae]|uniref:Uncharacterized protein n=1 Tax=Roseateles violae TaxID=3058042 RepID=A0ABT8DWG4_9BURK|nr:hypothetical protein [Pelomonas sp. PFR6]MDN3922602.1 hypothetical protein [Pelomonas sp. PFR6]